MLEERDCKGVKKLTEIKEYTLKRSKRFIKKVIKEFSQPMPDELAIQKFQGFFKKEKDFWRHLFKHGIPEDWKIQAFETNQKLSWEEIKNILQNQYWPDFVRFSKQYFTKMLGTLAHVSRTFYDLPFEGAKPTITLFSGYKRHVVVTFDGDKLQSVYTIKGKLADYINERKAKSLRFEEVGIDDEIRALARKIRDLHKRFGGDT